MTDEQILDLYHLRQESALEETRQKYGQRLYRTAMNILRNNQDAEECVNDVLLKAWQAIPPGRPAMLGAFLAKISRNLAINKWKAKTTAKRGGEFALTLSELEDCIPSSSGPESEFESSLVTQVINTFLEETEKTTRTAFILRYFHGESIRDISENFNISESKTKSMLFRARKKLCAYLEREGITL